LSCAVLPTLFYSHSIHHKKASLSVRFIPPVTRSHLNQNFLLLIFASFYYFPAFCLYFSLKPLPISFQSILFFKTFSH